MDYRSRRGLALCRPRCTAPGLHLVLCGAQAHLPLRAALRGRAGWRRTRGRAVQVHAPAMAPLCVRSLPDVGVGFEKIFEGGRRRDSRAVAHGGR